MTKTITVEELAANLQEHLAAVSDGTTLTVVASGKAIATLAPPLGIERLVRHRPDASLRFQDVDLGPRPKNLTTDAAQIIIDERNYERSEKKWRP